MKTASAACAEWVKQVERAQRVRDGKAIAQDYVELKASMARYIARHSVASLR